MQSELHDFLTPVKCADISGFCNPLGLLLTL